MKNYNFRLACGLYDQVELLSMRKTPVKITYKMDDDSALEILGIITDVYVRNKIEYIQINGKHEIETSLILNIQSNPKPFK
ncbi:MAG: hypothetical protein DRI86_07265 [Bacteroidetes bacterium]|nr:MAG: hypothetical protein DRI86_07265 [Bacteroidota bacterium]